jgi:glucan-binding YG repeat protein
MSNSSLVNYTKLSPNHSGKRTHTIDRITPHCVVGQVSVERLGSIFAPASRKASCNYGIGSDGRVGLYCDEGNRSWCSSSNANDQRAVTIECASDTTHPYAFKEVVYNKLIDLCADICKRNGKNKLIWINDKNKALNYTPKSNEMLITVHRWFANKACPGDWLMNRMGDLVTKVNAKLSTPTPAPTPAPTPTTDTLYRVRKSWADSKSQIGAYKSLENAKKNCKEGYSVFDNNGNVVYTNQKQETKYIQKKVIAKSGLWLHTRATTSTSTRKRLLSNGTLFLTDTTSNGMAHGYAIINGEHIWGWVSNNYIQ